MVHSFPVKLPLSPQKREGSIELFSFIKELFFLCCVHDRWIFIEIWHFQGQSLSLNFFFYINIETPILSWHKQSPEKPEGMRRCAFLTTRLMKIERAQQAPENGVRFPFRVDDLIELLKKKKNWDGSCYKPGSHPPQRLSFYYYTRFLSTRVLKMCFLTPDNEKKKKKKLLSRKYCYSSLCVWFTHKLL